MAKIGIILLVDNHYGIVRNHYSLAELIRDYTNQSSDRISIRSIIASNISSICRVYPHKLEVLKDFISLNDKTFLFIGIGLSDFKSGYDIKMLETHIKGIVQEFETVDIDSKLEVGLLDININNRLNGHFLLNYKNTKKLLYKLSEDLFIERQEFEAKILFLNNGDYVISTRTIPNMIKSICDFVYKKIDYDS